MQRHVAIVVAVRRARHERAHFDVGAELLLHFAAKRLLVALAGGDFASGKLPHSGQVYAGLPAGDEEPVAILDHRSDDVQGRAAHGLRAFLALRRCGDVRQKPFIGHPSQRGVRGAHTVAPRSIKP